MADDRKRDDLPSPFPAIFLGAVAARNLAARGDDLPKRAMEHAERLRAKGASEGVIWAETNKMLAGTDYAGVSYGADGKPRFELTDHTSRVRPGALDKSGHGFQGEFLVHPKIYDAMPEARFLVVQKGGQGSGGYTGDKVLIGDKHFAKTAFLGRPQAKPTARGVNLHELQHHVQDVEGFAPGGSPRDFEKQFPGPQNEGTRRGMYTALAGEVEAENTRERANLTAEERRQSHPTRTAKLKRSEQIVTDQHGAIQEKFGGDLPKGYTVEADINPRMRQSNYRIFYKGGPLSRRKQVGTAYVRDTPNGPQVGRISINDKHQRKGIATALYAQIERDHGNKPVIPDATLSPKAAAFWRKHKPEALRDHVPFGDDGSLMWDPSGIMKRRPQPNGRLQEMADDSSGLRGTQNPENLKAILDNRTAAAEPEKPAKPKGRKPKPETVTEPKATDAQPVRKTGWKPTAQWSDAEKWVMHPNGEKTISKSFIRAYEAEIRDIPSSDPTKSLKAEHAKILAGTRWRADGTAYVPALLEAAEAETKRQQAEAAAQTTRGRKAGPTVATLRAEAKAAGIKGVSKMTKAALLKALDKTGAIAMVAAPAVAGLVAFDAARSEAKASGASDSEAKMQGVAQGAVAATVTGGVMYAVGKGVGLGVKALAKVAPAAAGPAGVALAVGLTGLAAYKAYQAHGAKGAALSVIGAEGLLDLGKGQPQAPTQGRLTPEQAATYAAAAKRYAAMKEAAAAEPEKRPKGWSNAARIAAAKARGAEVPYGGHAEQGPPQWAPSVSTTDVAAAMKKAS